MSRQPGYTIVDVDEDLNGDISGQGQDLQFKTFLPSPQDAASTSHTARQDAPQVPYSPFQIAYYQSYFDVDTSSVLKRVGLSMFPRESFIADACDGQVDLYGPFWTLTTLILALYTTATLSSSIVQYLASPNTPINSNIPLLSTAVSIIYLYGLGVPALLWGATKWLGITEWGLAEALGVYGYAMSVFVPITLLCLIPVGILRWVLVAAGAATSGTFIVKNVYPVLSLAEANMPRMLIIAVIALHAALALALKVLFFSYSVDGVNIGPDPITPTPTPTPTS